MAFVNGSGTASFRVRGSGHGALLMSSKGTAEFAVDGAGSLFSPVRLKGARALSSTRIRVDFTSGVDNNSALSDPRNYKVQTLVAGTAPGAMTGPSVLRVDVPSQTNPKFVELVVSEMVQDRAYGVAINSTAISLESNIVADGDMEAVGTSAYLALAGSTTLSKQTGTPGGSGVQVLRIDDSITYGYAYQRITHAKALYKLDGWARGDGATAPPAVGVNTIPEFIGTTSNTWQRIGPMYVVADGTGGFNLIKYDTSGYAEFDDITLQQVVGSVQTGVSPVTGGSIPVARDVVIFNGIGVKPQIKLVLAQSSTSVLVQFDEPIRDAGDLDNPSAYVFDNGLTVSSVLDVGVDAVTLETSEQDEGQLYTLTLTGVITDDAGNAMDSPATSLMLGFAPGPVPIALLQLSMYRFLRQALRDEDQTVGKQFIERFVEGPQTIWSAITQSIYDLPKLWSVEDCPDDLLQYLKRIVGWTRRLDGITNPLDADTLRRLIAASAQFWKQRGPEDAIVDILRLTTGERMYIQNWFDLRIIVGETELGEDHEGTDPWLLSVPGEGEPDAWTYNIRIVDSGVLSHQLVKDLCRLTRPNGERVLITYLGLLDLFDVNDDLSQWDTESWSTPVAVVGGSLVLNDKGAPSGQGVFANAEASPDWTNYLISWKAATSTSFSMEFYRTSETDMYLLAVDADATNQISLWKVTAGVPTNIATVDVFADFGERISQGVFYTYRIQIYPDTPGSSTNRIKVWFDGTEVIDETDEDHAQGTVGVQTPSGGDVSVAEVEMLFLPSTTDFIDINT